MPDVTGTGGQAGEYEHPGLTIRIRRINAAGVETSASKRVKVKPGRAPLMTAEWPPCQCPRCRGAKR